MMRYYLEEGGWISPNGENGKGKTLVIQGLRRRVNRKCQLRGGWCGLGVGSVFWVFFFNVGVLFLAILCSLWDLSSSTRVRIHAP